MYPSVEIYIEDARNFQRHGQYDLAIETLWRARECDIQHVFEAEIQKLLSFNYRKLGKFDLALLHINAAVNLTKNKDKAKEEYAICLMNKGVLYEEIGDSEKALECYLPALEIFTNLLSAKPEKHGIIINALLTIGLLYYRQKQYLDAKEHVECALPYFGYNKETDRRHLKVKEILEEIDAMDNWKCMIHKNLFC